MGLSLLVTSVLAKLLLKGLSAFMSGNLTILTTKEGRVLNNKVGVK